MKYFLWLNLERTLDKRRNVGVVTRRQVRKSHCFAEGDDLKRLSVSLKKKVGDTVSCCPGDTNFSDATALKRGIHCGSIQHYNETFSHFEQLHLPYVECSSSSSCRIKLQASELVLLVYTVQCS